MLLSFLNPILSVTNLFFLLLLLSVSLFLSLSLCRMPSLWKKEGSSCRATFAWWWTNWSRHCRSSQLAPPKRPCCLCCLSVCKWTHTGVFDMVSKLLCGCVWVRQIQGKGCRHTCRARYSPPVCERLMQRFGDVRREIHAGAFVGMWWKRRDLEM